MVLEVWSGLVLTGLGPLDWSPTIQTKDQTSAGPDQRPVLGLVLDRTARTLGMIEI
jgi:hypothetical protein